MNILITHAYTADNKGDAAILSIVISELKKAFPDADIVISAREKVKDSSSFEGIRMVSDFMYEAYYTTNNRLLKLFNTVFIISTSLFWVLIYKATKKRIDFILRKPLIPILNEYIKADIVIPTGGGYIRGKNTLIDTVTVILLLHPMLLTIMLGKTIVLYSQSIGPLGNHIQQIIAKYVLNHVNAIIVREDISVAILKKLGIREKLIKRSVDAGFLFNSSTSVNLSSLVSIPKEELHLRKFVGITARKWLKNDSQEKYESEVAKFADSVIKRYNMDVIFIPQVTAEAHNMDDDREVSKRIINKMQSKDRVWFIKDKLTHHEIKALYSNLAFIVGTRFHSVIFSLTAYVPALAIEYEHKTRGIMSDLNLSEWVVKIEDVRADVLSQRFGELVKRRSEYIKTLKKNLPPYIDEARKTISHVVRAYNMAQKTEN